MVDFFEAIAPKKEEPKREVVINRTEDKPSSHFNPPAIIRPNSHSPAHSGRGTHNPNGLFNAGNVRFFTYGTFKRRNIRHNLLGADAKFICEGYLDPSFSLKQTTSSPGIIFPASGFPIAVKKKMGEDKDRRVKGELYELPVSSLRKLDVIENEGRMYIRERVPVYRLTEDPKVKEMYQAYCYIGAPDYWDKQNLYLCPTEDHPIPHYVFNPYAETARSIPDVG